MKSFVKYLPTLGWSFWFSDYVFLKRSFEQDKHCLQAATKQWVSYDFPWMVRLLSALLFKWFGLINISSFVGYFVCRRYSVHRGEASEKLRICKQNGIAQIEISPDASNKGIQLDYERNQKSW